MRTAYQAAMYTPVPNNLALITIMQLRARGFAEWLSTSEKRGFKVASTLHVPQGMINTLNFLTL